MPPGGEGERRAAAGEAGAADFAARTRLVGDGASAARGTRMLRCVGRAPVCRAGFAGRGTPLAFSTERHTLAAASDPRRSLGPV